MIKIIPCLLFSLVILFLEKAEGQTGSKYEVSEDEIYNFILSDSVKPHCFLIHMAGFGTLIKDSSFIFGDTIFSKRDIQSFRKQISQRKKIKWKAAKLPGVELFTARTRKELDRKGTGYCTEYISIPLFSADRSRCIIVYTFHLYMAGYGQVELYSKKNGTWSFVKHYDKWIQD